MLRLLILAVTVSLSVGQWDPNYADDRFGIVHLFEWHWDTIADECETLLAPNKIAGVQTSPPNENRVIDTRPWWERYQPISYILGTRSGDRNAFIDMVNRCNAVGVRIYPDIVVNHMCGNGGSGTGTAGSSFNADKNNPSFPAVPYGSTDFNADNCYTASGEIENYGDANQVRNCMLVGLLDLNQGKDYVRGKIIDYMNDLIDIGVAGFRVDACKHMWPGDLSVIFGSLNDLRSDIFGSGARPYVFQEVIDQGGEPITAGEYTGVGSVTEFKYGINLGNNRNSLQYLSNFGESWGMLDGYVALSFINNHDNQRGHGGGGNIVTFENPYDLKILTAYMLAWPYGVTRVMSSYYFSNSDEGPPSNQRSVNADGSCGNGWVCEHRWRSIKNMFAFGNAVQGTGVVHWWDNGDNQIAFGREGKGFLAINKAGYTMNENLPTGLPAGSYCNVILGDFYDGKCAGECITVGSNGYANINIGDGEDPMVAIHVDAMTTECGAGGGSTGGGTGGNGGGGSSTTCTDCSCPDSEKVDCGELASTEETCEATGCIWCPLAKRANVPWCIYKASETSTSSPSSSSSSAPSTSCTDCDCQDKIDCGELASTAESCAASGCLWCPLEDGSTDPWCFHVSSVVTTTTSSSGGSSSASTAATTTTTSAGGCEDCSCATKYECGYYGIGESECETQGCLWCPTSSDSDDPWCIMGSDSNNGGTPTCAVGESLRQDCGYMGIGQTECESMSCCWEESNTNGVPWCYYKA